MSTITITKTSLQAKNSRSKNKDNSCPECNFPALGSYRYESKGILHLKQVKVDTYRCIKCGCEWEVRNDI